MSPAALTHSLTHLWATSHSREPVAYFSQRLLGYYCMPLQQNCCAVLLVLLDVFRLGAEIMLLDLLWRLDGFEMILWVLFKGTVLQNQFYWVSVQRVCCEKKHYGVFWKGLPSVACALQAVASQQSMLIYKSSQFCLFSSTSIGPFLGLLSCLWHIAFQWVFWLNFNPLYGSHSNVMHGIEKGLLISRNGCFIL